MAGASRKTKVIIIDDEDDLRLLARTILEEKGYEVIEAANGREGLEAVRLHRPDIILLDVMLPDVTGLDVCRQIKTDPVSQGAFVILVSGVQVSSEYQAEGLDVGADGYILKPLTNREFLARVNSLARIKRAEDALRESEERFRSLYENSFDGIMLATDDGTVVSANKRMCEMLGMNEEEILAAGREAVVLQDEEFIAGIDRRERTGRFMGELTYRRKDGSIFPVELSANRFTNAAGQAMVSLAVRDITERKKAEARLRESEERYRSIFENAIEGIFQRALDGKLLAVNPALAHMHGYASPEEMISDVVDTGQKHLFVDWDLRNRYRALIEEHGMVRGFEAEQYRKDGSKFWLSFNTRAVKDAEGRVLYYEGIVEDITEKKKMEDQLRQAQKMEAIGTLAGGIAHDFNNILTVISGFATLMQMNMKTDDPSRPFVDQVLASSERAASLVQSLLAFSRKQRMEFQPRDINDLVRSTGKLLKRLLPEDIELVFKLTDEKAICVSDVTQIDQILMNLTTNARDAMPRGGSLTFETRMVGDASIDTEDEVRPGRYVMLSASDTGVGMDEVIAKRIFDPFFTTKEVGKGTGLGLSSVYGIVKQHEGHITVKSSPNRGATFSIYLPLAATGESENILSPDEGVRGGETILIAEDDPDVRRLAAQILQSYGYTTIEAGDGVEAIRMFNENRDKVNLVILDVVMPRKNGWEVFEEIRQTRPDVKVLFVSGYTGDVVIDRGVESEAVDFIPKPVSVNKLLRKVREVLER